MRAKLSLTLTDTPAIAAAAEAYAGSHRLKVSIAIADESTYLQHLLRMDGAPCTSAEGAMEKARTAAEGKDMPGRALINGRAHFTTEAYIAAAKADLAARKHTRQAARATEQPDLHGTNRPTPSGLCPRRSADLAWRRAATVTRGDSPSGVRAICRIGPDSLRLTSSLLPLLCAHSIAVAPARIRVEEPSTGGWTLTKTASAAAPPGKRLNPPAYQPSQGRAASERAESG